MNQSKPIIFRGAATALITPFRDGEVDLPAFGALIDRQLCEGIDALVIAGTTGEASTLSDREHKMCLTFAAERVAGRLPMIAGTGSNDTHHAVEMSRFAESAGYDGLLCVTPYYNKATDEGLIRSYLTIAEATRLPLIPYNVPSRTGVSLSPPVYRTLSRHPNIVAVKEASGDVGLCAKLLADEEIDLALYSGNDDITVPLMALGGLGVISVASNLVPRRVADMCRMALSGDIKTAAAEQLTLMPLVGALFAEVNPIPVKWAAAQLGLCRLEYRLPLCEPSAATQARLSSLLERHKGG